MTKKSLLIIYILIASTLIFTTNSFAGAPSKKIKKELSKALQSTNPKKVDKCLDKIIKAHYMTGVLRIRQHAKRMLQSERSKIIRANQVTKKTIDEKLLPWVNIKKRTVEYFVKKNVNQAGKENPQHLYRQ